MIIFYQNLGEKVEMLEIELKDLKLEHNSMETPYHTGEHLLTWMLFFIELNGHLKR
ncbi:hypothetical protein [Bacillus sp. TL12]|uniref:hypothetical protein n=1 Tax=Bacillus sp. TL12 TaxID=2894756 RepID=UPI001F52612E|nr:hypothetical protein [Bacillus sp. TL12]MCI0765830.1 hypothetical protein [Bacillus sp. TL12]